MDLRERECLCGLSLTVLIRRLLAILASAKSLPRVGLPAEQCLLLTDSVSSKKAKAATVCSLRLIQNLTAPKLVRILPTKELLCIAAMRESSDSILIAADSQQIETNGIRSSTDKKLQWHPSLPLAWGASDNSSIGARFSEWTKQHDLSPSDNWITVQYKLAECLSRLNGNQRGLSKLAGVDQLPPEALSSVLVVGFLGTVSSIFEVDGMGMLTDYSQRDFHAIGTGHLYAHVAYKTLTLIPSSANTEEKLKTIVGITADMSPAFAPPVYLGRVTPTGFMSLRQ